MTEQPSQFWRTELRRLLREKRLAGETIDGTSTANAVPLEFIDDALAKAYAMAAKEGSQAIDWEIAEGCRLARRRRAAQYTQQVLRNHREQVAAREAADLARRRALLRIATKIRGIT